MDASTEGKRRLAVFLDLENLLYAEGQERAGALLLGLVDLVRGFGGRDTLVVAVACCNRGLAGRVAFLLREVGVRVHPHGGGPEAADMQLMSRIDRDLPGSCHRAIIGSGDGRFAAAAHSLRDLGIRVEVMARAGSLAKELRAAADEVHWLVPHVREGAA